jgi:hypothetical protein
MNDTQLESQLRSMRPAAPSTDLMARVQRDMELNALLSTQAVKQRQTLVWASRMTWSALGAAAAVALMFALPQRATTSTTPTLASIATTPVINSSRELLNIDEGDIIIDSDGTPGQLVSVASIERHQWVDPRNGAEYIVEVPQEDDLLVPLHFQ